MWCKNVRSVWGEGFPVMVYLSSTLRSPFISNNQEVTEKTTADIAVSEFLNLRAYESTSISVDIPRVYHSVGSLRISSRNRSFVVMLKRFNSLMDFFTSFYLPSLKSSNCFLCHLNLIIHPPILLQLFIIQKPSTITTSYFYKSQQ